MLELDLSADIQALRQTFGDIREVVDVDRGHGAVTGAVDLRQ